MPNKGKGGGGITWNLPPMVTLLIKGNYHGNIIASQPIKIKDSMKFIIDIRVAINGKFYAIVLFYH